MQPFSRWRVFWGPLGACCTVNGCLLWFLSCAFCAPCLWFSPAMLHSFRFLACCPTPLYSRHAHCQTTRHTHALPHCLMPFSACLSPAFCQLQTTFSYHIGRRTGAAVNDGSAANAAQPTLRKARASLAWYSSAQLARRQLTASRFAMPIL